MNSFFSLENVPMTLDHKSRLNLYASLNNQTPAQAAQSILAEWLDTIGDVRIEHRIGKLVDEINRDRKPRRKVRTSRTFEELITSADQLHAHGMGITLD